MRCGGWWYGVVLVASAVGNVVLFASAEPHATPPTSAVRKPLRLSSPAVPDPGAVLPPAPVASLAALDRAALEERLARAEATLDKLLPLPEKFEMARRDPGRETALTPLIDKAMTANAESDREYVLECRGLICRVDAHEDGWLTAFSQASELVGAIESQLIGPDGAWIAFEKPGRAEGRNWSVNVLTALHASPESAACKQANPTPGSVGFDLVLDRASRVVRVAAQGTLAEQASGVCIRRVLEDLIRTRPIPAAATEFLDETFWVSVP